MLMRTGTSETLATAVADFTQFITPYLPLLGTVFGGVIVGIFAVWNRKRGAVETRAPDVNELWQQQAYQFKELDAERRLRMRIQRYADELIRVFRGYVCRVQTGGDIRLTHHERLFHDSDPPTSETVVVKYEPPLT